MPRKTFHAATSQVRASSWLDGVIDGPRLGIPLTWWRGDALIDGDAIIVKRTSDYMPVTCSKDLVLAMASVGYAFKHETASSAWIQQFVSKYGMLKHANSGNSALHESVEDWKKELNLFYELVHWFALIRMASWGDEEARRQLYRQIKRLYTLDAHSISRLSQERADVLAEAFLAEYLNIGLEGATVQIVSGAVLNKLKVKMAGTPAEFYLTIRANNLLQVGYRELAFFAVDRKGLVSCLICNKIFEGRKGSRTCSAKCRKKLSNYSHESQQ